MKYYCALVLLCGLIGAPQVAYTANLSEQFSGRILLQVQEKGKAWYVDPLTKTRAYLGRPSDAFRVMRELGLGISNSNLEKIAASDEPSARNHAFTRKFAGRILLQVEANGESWYVNPIDLKRYFLGRPTDAFQVMRGQGLGISNENINRITRSEKYADPEQSSVYSTATPSEPHTEKPSTQPQPQPQPQSIVAPSKNISGSYRCYSYNVSGGGGGDCRLFTPIILNKDGTYSVSSEKGTYSVSGDTVILSESKLRGQGKLIGDTQLRFEYDYNSWHHVLTYLREDGIPSISSSEAVSEVPVQITLEYPEKDSTLNSIATMELVGEGQDVKKAGYKPTAIAVWDGDRRVTASFHKTTNTPQTGKKYDVYANWGAESTKMGQIDLTQAKTQIVTVIKVLKVGGTNTEQKEETPSTAPARKYAVLNLTLQYKIGDESLHNVTKILLRSQEKVPVSEGSQTLLYEEKEAIASYGAAQQLVASFNYVLSGIVYDVYVTSYSLGEKKVGMLDMRITADTLTKTINIQ